MISIAWLNNLPYTQHYVIYQIMKRTLVKNKVFIIDLEKLFLNFKVKIRKFFEYCLTHYCGKKVRGISEHSTLLCISIKVFFFNLQYLFYKIDFNSNIHLLFLTKKRAILYIIKFLIRQMFWL